MSAAAQIGAQWIFLVKIAVLDLLLRKKPATQCIDPPPPQWGHHLLPQPPQNFKFTEMNKFGV